MRHIKHILVLVAFTLVLCACGQRGDLYLPEKNPEPNQPESSFSQNNQNFENKAKN